MTDGEHVHGPECTSARVIGPFTSRPVLTLVLTEDDLDNHACGYVETVFSPEMIPVVLRALALKFERANKAKLS